MGQRWSAVKPHYALSYSEYSVRGLRDEMEDAFVADVTYGKQYTKTAKEKGLAISSLRSDALFGIFDGHSGDKASIYASRNLPRVLFESDHYPSRPKEALIETFHAVDKAFLKLAIERDYPDGSTGLVALVQGDTLYVANAGDSRAVLCVDQKAVVLSEDHTPSLQREFNRIQKHGGKVTVNPKTMVARINGRLAVSRGFGDLNYKNKKTLGEKFSSVDPDISQVPITDTTQFLILACDGFWDTVENQDAVDFVLERLLHREQCTLYEICIEMTTLAYNHGSTDNISIVLVAFDHTQNATTGSISAKKAKFGLRSQDPLPKGNSVAKLPRSRMEHLKRESKLAVQEEDGDAV